MWHRIKISLAVTVFPSPLGLLFTAPFIYPRTLLKISTSIGYISNLHFQVGILLLYVATCSVLAAQRSDLKRFQISVQIGKVPTARK